MLLEDGRAGPLPRAGDDQARAGLADDRHDGIPALAAHRVRPAPALGPACVAGSAGDAKLPERDNDIRELAEAAVPAVVAQVPALGDGQDDLVVARRGGGHIRSRGMRATPAYRSAGWRGMLARAGRHWATGTTPGGTSGRLPNRALTWVWVRAVIPAGTRLL